MSEISTAEMDQPRQTLIAEIKPIEKNRNEIIKTRQEIRNYVETPLVDACEHMWDLNIRTLASSANSKDIGYQAYIIVDFDSLSEENKKIARESGVFIEDYDGRPAVKLEMPIVATTTAESIKTWAGATSEKLCKQKASWIPSYDLGDLRSWWAGLDRNDEKYGIDDFKEEGFFYDPDGKRFYLSEEHFRKVMDDKRTESGE